MPWMSNRGNVYDRSCDSRSVYGIQAQHYSPRIRNAFLGGIILVAFVIANEISALLMRSRIGIVRACGVVEL